MFQDFLELIIKENNLHIILGLIGGLGIFLYGIKLMGDSLQSLAGNKLKMIIEKLTNNIFVGIIVGMVVTTIIQSSSGTTALSISLIRAGLMSMPQAIGIIMGANIGTTTTAFLFSFPSITEYSLLFIGVGAFLIFFMKNKRILTIGRSILGFGLLFYGMDLMGNGLKDIINGSQYIRNLLISFEDYPWLGLLTGMIVTGIIQSSSATTGIIQTIIDSGELTIAGAIPILFGNNIGTTITALIAAIGGSIAAKRAASFHVLFNVLGALFFMILLAPYTFLIETISKVTNASPRLSIAYAHFIFNMINTIILVWFYKEIIWLIKKIIPGDDDLEETFNLDAFNERLIKESPILALESTKIVIHHMATIVNKMFDLSYESIKNFNMRTYEEAIQLESIINSLDHKIHDYLVKITAEVDSKHSNVLSKYLDTIRDLERIGDHCENILELSEHLYNIKGSFTEDAITDLDLMFNTIKKMLEMNLVIISKNDKALASNIISIEEDIDRLEKKARKRHTIRVNDGICTSEAGFDFIEILSNLERIGDHSCNIAEYTLNDQYYFINAEPIADLRKINKQEQLIINIIPNKK